MVLTRLPLYQTLAVQPEKSKPPKALTHTSSSSSSPGDSEYRRARELMQNGKFFFFIVNVNLICMCNADKYNGLSEKEYFGVLSSDSSGRSEESSAENSDDAFMREFFLLQVRVCVL